MAITDSIQWSQDEKAADKSGAMPPKGASTMAWSVESARSVPTGQDEKTVSASDRPSESEDPERANSSSSSSDSGEPRPASGLGARIRRILEPPPLPVDSADRPPPDGGWQAWSVCLCTHMVFANTWGFINSFGIFQTYYADFLAPLPPSTISWIGSVQVFLSFVLSAVTGRLGDAGYFRSCYWFGMVCMMAGMFGTASGTRYWQLMLSQGVATGLGAGFLCCPTMSIVTTYFHKRRALAIGIISCGNVSGGLVYPAMARQLLPRIGFAWTLRSMAFMQLGMLVVAGLVIRPRIRPRSSGGALFDWAALRDPEYMIYLVAMIFNIGGTFIVYYYIASFGRAGITPVLTYPQSLNLLLIFNGIGIFGRLTAAHAADHIGPLNILLPMAAISAVLCFSWIAVTTMAGIYGWVCVYGIIAGALQAMLPAGLSSLTPDISKIGQRIGMGFTFIGVAVIAGPPAAGALVTDLDGRYLGVQVFAGSMLVVGTCLIAVAKVVHMRRAHCSWWAKI